MIILISLDTFYYSILILPNVFGIICLKKMLLYDYVQQEYFFLIPFNIQANTQNDAMATWNFSLQVKVNIC